MSYFKIPEILLPKKEFDYSKWATIACDQFTSQPDYWESLRYYIGDAKSTLDLVLPEVYLETVNKEEEVKKINKNMADYLKSNMFDTYNNFIYVERELAKGVVRHGLMIAVDLEAYDYAPDAKLPIRATERTVKERLPIRIEIRKDAPIEIPHICIFMDDREDKIFSALKRKKNTMEKLYDFELNLSGGHVRGYLVEKSDAIVKQLDSLLDPELLQEKYKTKEELLFVVGDGNHSLATAKECWNLVKKDLTEEEQKTHPARYALCELQNIHDEAIVFEPIHRFIGGANEDFVEYLQRTVDGDGTVRIVYKGIERTVSVNEDPTVAIADLQNAIDKYMAKHPEMYIDYIHGDDYLLDVAKEKDGIALFMPKIEKNTLFSYVTKHGVLPRKSFSMGHAESKRYYLECRKVK